MDNDIKVINQKTTILYNSGQTPPFMTLFFSALQHLILLLSMGMAVPVTIARVSGLDLNMTTSLIAAGLFAVGFASILQTVATKYIGSGYMNFAGANSTSLSACVIAAQTGGIPLVLGMTVFSSVLRFVLGSFTYKLRRFFPAEVTGTMIFILGINLVPTALENFLGVPEVTGYNTAHLIVALSTFVFMLSCTLFIKPLKPYTALVGIVFGFAMSGVMGVFDTQMLNQVSNNTILALPIYSELKYSFDFELVIPFVVMSIATVIDNIGDFSASQSADNPDFKKVNWRSVEGGIRGNSLANIISGLMGGPMLTTSTPNIGIASAGGITSRKVVYLAGAMLMLLSFFPRLTGVFALMPVPVLGAVLLYSGCYIMAGGFSILSGCVIDDRRIFSVFLSIFFSISTLVPGLYSFLPEKISEVLISPMVMGVCMLIITTIISRIGTKKTFSFETAVVPSNIISMNEEIEELCRHNGTDRKLMRRMQVSLDSLCESVYEIAPDAKLQVTITYDPQQLSVYVKSRDTVFEDDFLDPEKTDGGDFEVCLMILNNIYDSVKTSVNDGDFTADMRVDL